jgi:ABC-type transport system involved in multi-copper enzyme maturation permease subunit
MSDTFMPIKVISRKDISDALRDRFILILTLFLALAALVALVTGAISLSVDVATYDEGKALLISLGKDPATLAAPNFHPLKLLRGAIEQIEIIGAVLGILVGFRAAASERGRQTLALIMTRPLKKWQFLAGKYVAAVVLLGGSLLIVFTLGLILLAVTSGVGIELADIWRVFLVWSAATIYATTFFTLSFVLTLWMKNTGNALLVAFVVWLVLVLVAPQIGDTMDPDNQVAGGVFRQLQVPKAQEDRIKASYGTFEAIRTGIEAISITKHLERFSFAVLGVKDTYAGKPLGPILVEKKGDMFWIIFSSLGLTILMFALPLKSNRLTKE